MNGPITTHRWSPETARNLTAFEGRLRTKLGGDLDEPECLAIFEEFSPTETSSRFPWLTWYDEVDIVVAGAARVTMWYPPDYVRSEVMDVTVGDVFWVSPGLRVLYDVQGDVPYRHLLVQMPRPRGTAEENMGSFHNVE